MTKTIRITFAVCVFFGGREGGGGGAPIRHGYKESYKDLNLKNLISEWDSHPRPHEYIFTISDALKTELSVDLMSRASNF